MCIRDRVKSTRCRPAAKHRPRTPGGRVAIVVKGRHQAVSEACKTHAADKCAKLARLDQRVVRIDVEVSKERNPRQADLRERVELTCVSKGPVVRAEASARDQYAALD